MAWELAAGSGTLGAGLAIASAAVVTLYLLKVKRRRQPVVFLKLWQQVLAESQRTAWWRNLRRLFSLLLQLVLLALLFGALANPRRKLDATDRTIVVVVDASASMQTADLDGKATRFAAAQKAALALLTRLGPRDRATVILADHHPRALGAIGSDVAELRRQLAAQTPSETPLDLEATLRLAADLLRGQPQPTIALFTDGAFTFPPNVSWQQPAPADSPAAIDLHGVQLALEPFGKQAGNVGITAFSARRYRANLTAYEVLIEIGSSFATEQTVEIELALDGQTVAVDTLRVDANGRAQKIYTNLAGSGANLEARIKTAIDAFAIDDHAYATLPRPRPLRVLLVTAGNLYLEGVLLLDSSLTVEKLAPSAWQDAKAARFDAIVFDRFLPDRLPATSALIIAPPAGAAASPFGGKRVVSGPILTDVDRAHPLMKWIALKDLNIGSSLVWEPKAGDAVLARALREPLLIAATRGRQRYVGIGFDLQQSDWPLRVAFPIFVTNTLSWFQETSEAPDLSMKNGVPRALQLDNVGPLVQIGTRTYSVVEGRVQIVVDRSGFHELLLSDRRSLTLPSSLLSSQESLQPLQATLTLDGVALGGPLQGTSGLPLELWPLLLLAALLLAAIEWWTYHRRVTV